MAKNKTAVISFIEKERAKGTDDASIQHQLLDAGWQMDIIRAAMTHNSDLSHPEVKSSGLLPTAKRSLSLEKKIAIGFGGVMLVLILLALFI